MSSGRYALGPGCDAVEDGVRLGADASLPTALSFEQEVLFRLYCSTDGQEGIDAFLEKRSPNFKGA